MNPLSYEIEELKRFFYSRFHEKHKDLLKQNPEEYHLLCRSYVDAKVYEAWISEFVQKGK